MARYWRRRYRRLRRRFRRYRRRRPVINNTSRSRVRVRVRSNVQIAVNIVANSAYSDVVVITPWMNQVSTAAASGNKLVDATLKTGMCESSLYDAMSKMYDEAKLDGVKIKCTLQDAIGLGGAFNSLKIMTCWDRKMKATAVSTQASYPNAQNIEKHGTYSEVTALNNTVARFTRSLWASDLAEKSTFVETEFDAWNLNIFGVLRSMCANSSYIQESGVLSMFAPAFLMCFQAPNVTTTDRIVHVNVDCYYWVTFRSPRYGANPSSAKDLPVRGVAFIGGDGPGDGGDVDMDRQAPAVVIDGDDAEEDDPVPSKRPHGVSGITPERQRIRRFGRDLPEGTVTIATRDTDDVEDPHARPSAADAAEAT